MAKKCNACGRFANTSDGVKCNNCTCLFHRTCVNIPKDAQVSLTWLCPECKAQTPRKDNTDTPVRGVEDDYGSPRNITAASVDNKTGEILHEIKLMRQEMKLFRDDFNSLRDESRALRGILEGYGVRMDSVESRLDCLENMSAVIQASPDVSSLLSTIEQLKSDLNDREQDSLLNDIEVTGIPEEHGENAGHLVRVLAERLGVVCDDRDFVSVERAGVRRAPSSGAQANVSLRPRPLVVRLARRQLRDAFLQAARVRRHLTTEGMGLTAAPTKLYVNERLSKHNRMIFFKAREQARSRGWRYVWSRGGRVFVRRESGKASFRVRLEVDLKKIFGGEPDDVTTQSTSH